MSRRESPADGPFGARQDRPADVRTGRRSLLRRGLVRAWHDHALSAGVLLLVFAAWSCLVVIAPGRPGPGADPGPLRIRGADLSFTLQEEAAGRALSAGGEIAPVEQILADHGANLVRLRVWVDPPAGTSDLASALVLARRARAAGQDLLLDLHYSDSWADRTTQTTPARWRTFDQPTLERAVERYTADTLAAFARQGTPVRIVQLGNEVTNGMLWPVGQVNAPLGQNWAGFTALLRAAVRGARSPVGGAGAYEPPAVMIHTDTGGDIGASQHVFRQLVAAGVDFDYIGLTYYPFWNGSLDALRANLTSLALTFGKDIVLAETAYPWTLTTGSGCRSVVDTASALPDVDRFPPTPDGQARFFAALGLLLREVPGGHGAGYVVWEPGWLDGVDAAPGVCNSHSNLTLFDREGRGLPALETFRPTS